MVRKTIHRTSTFAWSSATSLPLLATGTVAGALDESFSSESQLEIWEPDLLNREETDLGNHSTPGPKAFVKDSSRFNRLAWGAVLDNRPHGVLAAGMENGELALWDPSKILARESLPEYLIIRNTTHTGPVRGLDFNPLQTHLLASGAINGEVFIWDLKEPSKQYSPTSSGRSTKLDEITSLAWNRQVPHVLAGTSSSGYAIVWDLRGKREVVSLAYGGGAGTLAGQLGGGNSLTVGGRRGMSAIAWHPDNATRLITASEDDTSPVIMVWDLHNARAPEKILTGHEKGVLSLSWCKQDADLLLSCGKDNRALCWNPQTSEIIGELPPANNWAFQVEWCARDPDLFAVASFDGVIGIHSIQSTNEVETSVSPSQGVDIFNVQSLSGTTSGALSLKQPPKWLRRPASCFFGHGGRLTSVSNLSSAQGKNQSSVVHLRKVVTEQELVVRATKLLSAMEAGPDTLKALAEEHTLQDDEMRKGGWKALLSLFNSNSREELVTLLGFSKSEIASRVAEAVENLKTSLEASRVLEDEPLEGRLHEPVVSFAEPERDNMSEESDEKTPSEVSASVTSDNRAGDNESSTTVHSLFGDDGAGTPQMDAGSDFFSTLAQGSNQVHVPHTNYGVDSSVAATIGSGPSSVTSETMMKNNSFRIYPADESETDSLVTKALVLGDFESAVALCLSSDRFADAILLAVRGGQELLQRTQKAYFERCTTTLPYLRLFQSIVTNDLSDIVQNAELQEWQEIFVVLCTFASQDEFPALAEQLGRRLEFEFTLAAASDEEDARRGAEELRKNAILTYLASARLERLVNIWTEELVEDEKQADLSESERRGTQYSAHIHALQSFIEKVTVFRSATKYEDTDSRQPVMENADAKVFKLSSLYDRYLEYADLLASQGLVKEAVTFCNLIPEGYQGTDRLDVAAERARLLATASEPPSRIQYAPAAPTTYSNSANYQTPSLPPHLVAQAPGQPSAAVPHPQHIYSNANSYQTPALPPHLRAQHPSQPATVVPPPPPRGSTNNGSFSSATKRQDNGGWNDAPVVTGRAPITSIASKPAAITSPFPNQVPGQGNSFGVSHPNTGQATTFPPARPGSVADNVPPPPRPISRSTTSSVPPQAPGRMTSPAQQFTATTQQPPQGKYAPPPRAPLPGGQTGQTPPPPGPYRRPPAFDQPMNQPPATGAYAPPIQGTTPYLQGPSTSSSPHQQSLPQDPYAPPPGMPRMGSQPPPGGPTRGGPPPQLVGGIPPQISGQTPHLQMGGPAATGKTPPSAPPSNSSLAARATPPAPKHPPGDRSHIPEAHRVAYIIISEHLNRFKATSQPQQRRVAEDLERRINILFDALNCETLSAPVVEQLLIMVNAMKNHNFQAALAIHVDLLQRASATDDITIWMSAVKQLIMRIPS